MLKPLKEWICDACGDVIETPDAGLVIWQNDAQNRSYDFRIIHVERNNCHPSGHRPSLNLPDFLGERELVYLMSFLTPGPLIVIQREKGRPETKDLAGLADLIRRCHTPYYEEARQAFSDPEVWELFADSNEVFPYTPENLKRIIERDL